MTRTLTCIGCPIGCQITATLEGGEVVQVAGNTCRRGDDYARKECTHPMRSVTGTVRLRDGRMVSVRTADDVPKEKIFDVAALFATVHPEGPIAIGQVIIPDVCGTGVDVIATKNVK